MKEKVILAYSGGLDTTAIIPWLKENFDYEVICVCIDCGQAEELDGLEERAKFCGASKLYVLDVIDEFCDEYVMPCVKAHAVYENKYLLGTSMARPLIAKKLVEIARKEGATAICHGATGKGNGPWIPVNPKSNTARRTALTFPSPQTAATAVTVTCGTSAMKDWSWRIRPMSLTMSICSYWEPLLKKRPMNPNM